MKPESRGSQAAFLSVSNKKAILLGRLFVKYIGMGTGFGQRESQDIVFDEV